MSRIFSTVAFENLTALWENQTVDPNTLPQAGGLGSVWPRNGSYPATPTEIYYRSSLANVAGNRGWVKQNLTGLNIFNVTQAPYNCDPTGGSDCRVGVQLAITNAQAAGGGIIYFPHGTYLFNRFAGGSPSILALNNKQNIVFLGDGYNSLLRVAGDFALAGQWLFELRNQTARIVFHNFRMNGQGIINPNPAAQNHFIQMSDAAGTDVAPPSDIEINQVWFDPIVGDGVRFVGDITAPRNITNTRVRYCMFDMQDASRSRSNVECSRGADMIQIHYNWLGPVGTAEGGQNIDFEAGANPPIRWSIVGNICFCQNAIWFTLSGVDSPRIPTAKNTLARNITTGNPGGTLEGVAQPTQCLIYGNVMTVAGSSGTFNTVELRNLTESLIAANVIYSLDNTDPRSAILIFADNPGTPQQVEIVGNVCGTVANATNLGGFRLETVNQLGVLNNQLFFDCTASAGCSGTQLRSINAIGADWSVSGNMFIATAGTFSLGIFLDADPNTVGNVVVNNNLVHTVATGISYNSTIANFTGLTASNDNIVAGATVAVVTPPVNAGAVNVGTKNEGTASRGPSFAVAAAVPNANITGFSGSVALDTAGTADSIFFTKESGANTNTGWIADGAVPMEFGALALTTATAGRFIAPGFALVTEITTEIKVPVDRPGTLRNMRLKCVAGTGGTTVSFIMRVNGADATLSLTVNNTAATGSGNAGVPTVAAGDLIGVRIIKGTAPTTPQTFVVITVEITS